MATPDITPPMYPTTLPEGQTAPTIPVQPAPSGKPDLMPKIAPPVPNQPTPGANQW
jgi:hypothetical protein